MKGIKFSSTARWAETFAGLEGVLWINIVQKLVQKYKCDMYIFEYVPVKREEDFATGTITISMEGYNIETEEYIKPQTIQYLHEAFPIEKFWCKLDDYGDHFVATFLFPDEY